MRGILKEKLFIRLGS